MKNFKKYLNEAAGIHLFYKWSVELSEKGRWLGAIAVHKRENENGDVDYVVYVMGELALRKFKDGNQIPVFVTDDLKLLKSKVERIKSIILKEFEKEATVTKF